MNKSPPLIFVVEDTLDIRTALEMVLEAEGFATASATNGAEALEQLRAGLRPQLILLDLNMPVMTGQEFLAERRASGIALDVPVVVLAATLKSEPLPDVVEQLRKPVGIDSLLESISRGLAIETLD